MDGMSSLKESDVSILDSMLLEPDGGLKLFPAKIYHEIPWELLRMWMHYRCFYGIPTQELINYLHPMLDPKKSIEIGAGRGDFCRHLGIPGTDSKNQEWPDVKAFYKSSGQPTIQYPPHVEELSATQAVYQYKPETVFGSWITQRGDTGQASMYGVPEEYMLTQIKTYIMFGSTTAHGRKEILREPHEAICEPWMISRAEPQHRRLFIWRSK